MNASLNMPLRINFSKLLLVVGLAVTFFVLYYKLSAKYLEHTTSAFTATEVATIAEEIYDTHSITESVKNLPLDAARIAKLTAELERILDRATDRQGCEVYFLKTRRDGLYPILGHGDVVVGTIGLMRSEVWKVGKTCIGENKRYSNDVYYKSRDGKTMLDYRLLEYSRVYVGAEKECLIMEKLLIYTYPLWSGHSNLIRPPGGKIDR